MSSLLVPIHRQMKTESIHYAIENLATDAAIERNIATAAGSPQCGLIAAPNAIFCFWLHGAETDVLGSEDFRALPLRSQFFIPSVPLRLRLHDANDGDSLANNPVFTQLTNLLT